MKNPVWIICPKCNRGRYTAKARTRRPTFSGVCRECYIAAEKKRMANVYRMTKEEKASG